MTVLVLVSFFLITICAAIGAYWCWKNKRFNGESRMLRHMAYLGGAWAYLFVSVLVAGMLDTAPKVKHSTGHTVAIVQALVILAWAFVRWVMFLIAGKSHD